MMTEVKHNPFTPIELWTDVMVSVKEEDERKQVDAKHYHVRYLIGESDDRSFIDGGTDTPDTVSDKTLYSTPSIHKMVGDPFHFDRRSVASISGKENIENSRRLNRVDQCNGHEIVEVAFESPGVECCSMTKEEADKYQVPLKYLSGYLLGKSDGLVKIALTKTVLDSGNEYYESIHVIPEASIKQMYCLD
jgi:hypothetical protein